MNVYDRALQYLQLEVLGLLSGLGRLLLSLCLCDALRRVIAVCQEAAERGHSLVDLLAPAVRNSVRTFIPEHAAHSDAAEHSPPFLDDAMVNFPESLSRGTRPRRTGLATAFRAARMLAGRRGRA